MKHAGPGSHRHKPQTLHWYNMLHIKVQTHLHNTQVTLYTHTASVQHAAHWGTDTSSRYTDSSIYRHILAQRMGKTGPMGAYS